MSSGPCVPFRQLDERARARQRLEAAALAAAADRALLLDDRVADLAGHPCRSVEQPAVHDQPGADAGRDLQVGGVAAAGRRAPVELGQRAEVGVVVHVDRQLEPRRERLRRSDSHPAGQDRGRPHAPRAHVDRPGQAEAYADHVAARDARLGQHLLDQLRGRVEAGLGGVVGLHGALGLGEDRVAEVGGGHAQVALAEVDADGRPGRAAERQEPRRPAAPLRGAAVLALDEHPLGLELAHDARDRRPGEARDPRQVGPAGRARLAQRADDPGAVALAADVRAGGHGPELWATTEVLSRIGAYWHLRAATSAHIGQKFTVV